jgi:integrase
MPKKSPGYSVAKHPTERGVYVGRYRSNEGPWFPEWIPPEHSASMEMATHYAKQRYAIYRSTGSRKAIVQVTNEKHTLKTLAAKWAESLEARVYNGTTRTNAIARGTKETWMSCVNALVTKHDPELATLPIEQLTHLRLVQAFEVLNRKLAPFTVNNYDEALCQLFDDALGHEWITLKANPTYGANPMRHSLVRAVIPAPETIATKNGHDKDIVPQENAVKLAACESIVGHRRVLYVVAFTTGLRPAEYAGLTWGHLHLDDAIPYADVVQSMARHGADDNGNGLKATKGKSTLAPKKRRQPLHPSAVLALRAHHDVHWPLLTGRKPKDTDPVFTDKSGKFRIAKKWAELLRADLRTAGLPDTSNGADLTFAATRRSFATYVAPFTTDEELNKLMGHAGGTVAGKHYALHAAYLAPLAPLMAKISFPYPTSLDRFPHLIERVTLSNDLESKLASSTQVVETTKYCGTSSVGRASASQAECRRFESGVPLIVTGTCTGRRFELAGLQPIEFAMSALNRGSAAAGSAFI